MARKAFFSFHYDNDVWRANIVRNSWVTKPDRDTAGFIDAADFEEVERRGEEAVKRWIDNQLIGTSVTIVLIGVDTSKRMYVKYELEKSFERGNGLLGIFINGIKNRHGNTSMKGTNTFGKIGVDPQGNDVYFSTHYPCYDWLADNGYANLGKWIEEAAKNAGR